MAKIIDPDDLDVGTELTLDTAAKTFTLNVAGTLVAKDGVTIQALYSKFVDLWTTSTYNKFEFPMYTIDASSGQYQFGTDGTAFNGWKPADDATRQMLRDGGWDEYSAAGALQRQYVGIVSLGEVSAAAQLYYQRASGGTAYDFTFEDEANEGIQVFGDASNGDFDTRAYFKGYVREASKKYKDSTLADTGKTATGAFLVNLLLSNEDDLKIQDTDGNVAANAPYTGITVTYIAGVGFTAYATATVYPANSVVSHSGRWYSTVAGGTSSGASPGADVGVTWVAYAGEREIGGTYYAFNKVIDGNAASAEDIYTKIQYLLRQNSDIDSGSGTVTGKTADLLLNFVGDTLITTAGVYIDDYDGDDVNRLTFTDIGGVARNEPYTATGTLSFNGPLTSGGTGYYRMYFSDLAGANDFGLTGAITVDDALGADIAGTISGASIPFTFDYDGNVQGSRTPGTDAVVVVVAGNAGSAKPVKTTYTITRTTGQNIALVAETDRAYLV